MKVLVFCLPPLQTQICAAVEAAGHIAIAAADDPVQAVVRFTPHLLIVATMPDGLAVHLSVRFPDLLVAQVAASGWENIVRQALAQVPPPYTLRPYAAENRSIFHDKALREFIKGKLGTPKFDRGWEEEAQRQEASFLCQLQTAKANHSAARQYLECLLAQQADIDQELTYRIAHHSYKGLLWASSRTAQYVAVLAHYVSGVELHYLPRPYPASPTADYIHHILHDWGVYAVMCVSHGRAAHTLWGQISRCLWMRFTGENDEKLAEMSLAMHGTAHLVRTIAECQVQAMEYWLNPDRARGSDDLPRHLHRAMGVYRDFWGFSYLASVWDRIVEGYHSGTTGIVSYPVIAPPFRSVRASLLRSPRTSDEPTVFLR